MSELRDIPGFPGYRIGRDGSVWRTIRDRRSPHFPLRRLAHINVRDYPKVNLYLGARRRVKMLYVHRLLMMVWGPPQPRWAQCIRHVDGNPANCDLDNLAWATFAENEADKAVHGTRRARLSPDQVRAIRARYAAGDNMSAVAREHGVAQQTASDIAMRRTWRHS